MDIDTFIGKIATTIVNPLIQLLFAVALVYFLWGVFVYIRDADDPSGHELGRKHIIWGIIGLFIMTAVFAIMRIARTIISG